MTALAAACQGPGRLAHPSVGMASDFARQAREVAMNSAWQNRRLSELTAARGQPTLVMSIPGGGNPPSFVVVYGTDPATGCVDAFAVHHGTDPLIRIYHCR